MKIVRVEDFHADGGWRTLDFLKVTTDDGLVGWSEYNEGFGVGGVTELVHKFAPVAMGFDPREVGRMSESLRGLTRIASGAITHQAVAAIENACLDVKAKAAGVPVCALFGGPFRDRLPLYWSHIGTMRAWNRELFEKEFRKTPIASLDDLKRLGEEAVKRGFRAVKTNPMALKPGWTQFNAGVRMGPGFIERNPDAKVIGQMVEQLEALREGIGPHTGLMFDLNFGLRTEGFMRVARALEKFDLAWLEIDMHDPEALAAVRRSAGVPIASLESIHGLRHYRPYFANQSVDVAVVDVPWNGLWESVRIATLAEAFEVACAPHNFYGHLASLMSAHFCAAIPNFRISEYEVDDVPWKDELVSVPPVIENGELVLPKTPGWGADVNEEGLKAHPPRKKK
jgi:galactonate dehydratase